MPLEKAFPDTFLKVVNPRLAPCAPSSAAIYLVLAGDLTPGVTPESLGVPMYNSGEEISIVGFTLEFM